jgi:hypothetical protein
MVFVVLFGIQTLSLAGGEGGDAAPGNASTSVSEKKAGFFSGAEIYVDYGKLLLVASNFESKYEGGINFRFFGRVELAGEFGYAVLDPLKAYDDAPSYTITGTYYRIGLDYFIPIDKKNALYAGVRYGASQFSDKGEFLLESDFWEDYGDTFGSDNLQANWFEIILGSEMRLGKINSNAAPKGGFFLGWKSRLRILMNFENREEPRVYAIPGYGHTTDKTVPALNFYIKYRFGR